MVNGLFCEMKVIQRKGNRPWQENPGIEEGEEEKEASLPGH
ncbi:hypothetical protein [Merdimonas faecis]|nr:hypothetical protein [Merdimonas faecis]